MVWTGSFVMSLGGYVYTHLVQIPNEQEPADSTLAPNYFYREQDYPASVDGARAIYPSSTDLDH